MATVATPVISPSSGSFSTSVIVTITCATSGSNITYTLDGTDPTAGSTPYIVPFEINKTTVVKAKGFRAGDTDSATATETFTITSSNNQGQLVIAPVRPWASADGYPVAIAEEIKGGAHTVADLTARDQIPLLRRSIGMICYVISEDKTCLLYTSPSPRD